ncbi:MAG TPA: hypothetical protein VHO06_03260, partial [Polyangia bacterium]|nr:hypothetical protein [Polyangia bacterium]
VPLICRRGGVTRREVGAIRIGPRETTFEISGRAALEFADAAAETDPRAPHVVVERADAPTRPRAPHVVIERADAPPRPTAPHPAPPEQAPKRADGVAHRTDGPPPRRRDGFAPYARPRAKHPPHPRSTPDAPPKPHAHPKPHAPGKPHGHPKPHGRPPHPGPKGKHRKG